MPIFYFSSQTANPIDRYHLPASAIDAWTHGIDNITPLNPAVPRDRADSMSDDGQLLRGGCGNARNSNQLALRIHDVLFSIERILNNRNNGMASEKPLSFSLRGPPFINRENHKKINEFFYKLVKCQWLSECVQLCRILSPMHRHASACIRMRPYGYKDFFHRKNRGKE